MEPSIYQRATRTQLSLARVLLSLPLILVKYVKGKPRTLISMLLGKPALSLTFRTVAESVPCSRDPSYCHSATFIGEGAAQSDPNFVCLRPEHISHCKQRLFRNGCVN